MVIAIQFKRNIASAGIFSVVIYKFSYWQESSPIVSLEIDIYLKIRFYHTLQIYGLAINLKVKSNKKPLFDPNVVRN